MAVAVAADVAMAVVAVAAAMAVAADVAMAVVAVATAMVGVADVAMVAWPIWGMAGVAMP